MTEARGPTRILLVEDNPADALLLEATLDGAYPEQYQIERAAALAEARVRIAGGAFDVALVDLTLPDSDGLATVESLRAAAPAVPIIALTGMTDEAVAMEAVNRGAQDYLLKGKADAPLVARSIRYAIDRNRVEEELHRAHADLERKVRERTEELRKANQTLRMISECNEAVVRIADEFELAREICQIITVIGGYRMAWVGYAEDNAARSVEPVAAVGFEAGYLEKAHISWADNERGRGPTGACIRTGQVQVGRNFETDPHLAPWREEALRRGYRSSIALPLASGGKVFGALMIYAETPEFFDEGQVTLLKELADDMAFGIVALRAQVERDRARQVADRRADQLRALATELTQAEHRERRRLAHIIHDHLQQLLVGAKFGLGNLRNRVKAKAAQETLSQLSDTLDEAIRSARSLTAELSPQVLHEKGLAAGLEWLGRQMLDKHGLAVVVTADGAVEPATDEMRLFLYGAVRELLFNVSKYAGVNQADVAVRSSGGELVVTVTDAGAGFDLAAVEDRAAASGGFGLFSIRERLGYLGGRMEVQSAPGQGSRFTLVAPLQSACRAQDESPEKPAPSIRVLLADDHDVVRRGIACLIQEQPDMLVVGEAADGRAAVELAERLRPDVVVMDPNMPEISGVEATRLITERVQGIHIVGLSVHDATDAAQAMIQAGAGAYVTKGGPLDNLLAAIRACRSAAEKPLDSGT